MTEHLVRYRSARPPGAEIRFIVIHDTGGKTAAGTLAWFDNPRSRVSAHVLIDRDGTAYRCVPDAEKAWHAGQSSLWGIEDVNRVSLGLELVDDDPGDYPPPQLAAAIAVVTDWCWAYRIPLHGVIGHEHVAPGRKVDPGLDFPWWTFLLDVGERLRHRERAEVYATLPQREGRP